MLRDSHLTLSGEKVSHGVFADDRSFCRSDPVWATLLSLAVGSIVLLLVINGNALELLALRIGSAAGDRAALAVGRYDNATTCSDLTPFPPFGHCERRRCCGAASRASVISMDRSRIFSVASERPAIVLLSVLPSRNSIAMNDLPSCFPIS